MEDIVQYLVKAAENLPGIQSAIFLISGVIGIFVVIGALLNQVSNGRRGQGALPSTVAGLLVGSFLLSLPAVVDIVSVSFFGDASDPKIISSYTPVGGGDKVKIALQALVAMINVIGWYAVARGLWRWKVGPKQDQPGWFGSGLTFIVAGVIAVNFYVFMDILAVSVGAIEVGKKYFQF